MRPTAGNLHGVRGKPLRRYTKRTRQCKYCGNRLNSYNKGPGCNSCNQKKLNKESKKL